MQTSLLPIVALLLTPLLLAPSAVAAAAAAKVHTVSLGAVRRVPYLAADATASPAAASPSAEDTLKIRALIVDGRQKEWTVGDAHDVTDRSFTIRRALRINDALPTDAAPRFAWQPGPWLLVDRSTGRIAALHLPDFDGNLSDAVWYRDYAAYCGLSATGKTLTAVVAQISVRKAVVLKELSKWSPGGRSAPACAPAQWQRQPMRVTFQPIGGAAVSFEVDGAASALIEEGDNNDEP